MPAQKAMSAPTLNRDRGIRRYCSPVWRIALFLILLLAHNSTCAQEEEEQDDTTRTIYEKIEEFSKKGKVLRWVHGAIFVPPEEEKPPPAPNVPARRVNPYAKYKGRVIRKIEVDVTDPFGYVVEDTAQRPTNGLQRLGNKMHRKTRPVVVRNLLLMRPFDRLDPLKVSESERILRTSPAVNDARITVLPVKGRKDSVDVLVRVLDRWSIDVGADGDQSRANLRATERNLLGLGQELEQRAVVNFQGPFLELTGHHRIYNLSNTYLSSYLHYQRTEFIDRIGVSVDRPFYSPLALWAGGFSSSKTWIRAPIPFVEGEPEFDRIEPVDWDTWVARSFPLDPGVESGRITNFIVGTRLGLLRYDQRPFEPVTADDIYQNSTLFLASAALSQRQYYKERYLFRFGLTEDVPEGFLFKVTTGLRKLERSANMPYLGAELARGRNYENFGYLTYELGYGTFIGRDGIFDGTFRAGITYFSDLVSFGRWHLRQFVRANTILGFSKPAYSRLNLNVETMYGFESYQISGTHRALVNLETVAYAPWDLIGFRIAPVFLMGFGVLGDEGEPYLSGQVLSSFTLGLLVRNERLLMNTFEVAISFYPLIPETGEPLWKHNGFTDFDTRTRDFNFTTPSIIGYN
jgi:hypothetical protein